MTAQAQKPRAIPPRPTDGDWISWVKRHYPYSPEWDHYLNTRRERPAPGTAAELDDLRGVADRVAAADLAKLWFYIHENASRIESAHAAERQQAEAKEKVRLVKIARLALEGKLGDTHEARDDARATAQHYLHQSPEHCSIDDLHDWEKMHVYAKQIAQGNTVKRPKLAAEVRREQEQRRSLSDLDECIGAVQASRPRMTQQGLGQW